MRKKYEFVQTRGEFNPCLNQIRNRSAGHDSRAKHVNLGGLKEGLLPKQQRRTQLHIIAVQQHCSTAVLQYYSTVQEDDGQ